MKFIPYEVKTGFENMQIDNDLLESAIKNQDEEPVFRLYGWHPSCVSLGRNQKSDFIDIEFLKKNDIDVVRRLTGGRALLHDNEITYSFVCPTSYLKDGENVISSYKEISQILIDAFKKLDINLSFGGQLKASGNFCMLVSTGADLCYEGKKLIGSAQFRKSSEVNLKNDTNVCTGVRKNYILQHGSILYDYDKDLLEKVFNEKVDTSSIISLKEINPTIKKEDVLEVLRIVNTA